MCAQNVKQNVLAEVIPNQLWKRAKMTPDGSPRQNLLKMTSCHFERWKSVFFFSCGVFKLWKVSYTTVAQILATCKIDILEPISKVKELSTSIQENCKHTLQKIRQDKLKLGKVCDDNIANDTNSLRDPADRPKSLSDEQKQTIIEGGHYQPKLKSYTENPEIQSKKQHKFAYAWFQEYPHLEYSIKADTASCFVCCLFPTGVGREKSSETWIKGTKAWHKMKSVGKDKKGKLVQHFTSEAQTAALHDLAHFVQGMKHVDVMLNKQLRAAKIQEEENDLRNQEIIKILLDVARTLGRHELPFRGALDDENGNFVQITIKTGEGQAKEILKSLESRGAPKSDLVYQSYDYAASMSGVFNGAQQCLQNLLGRCIPHIPCQGHD